MRASAVALKDIRVDRQLHNCAGSGSFIHRCRRLSPVKSGLCCKVVTGHETPSAWAPGTSCFSLPRKVVYARACARVRVCACARGVVFFSSGTCALFGKQMQYWCTRGLYRVVSFWKIMHAIASARMCVLLAFCFCGILCKRALQISLKTVVQSTILVV